MQVFWVGRSGSKIRSPGGLPFHYRGFWRQMAGLGLEGEAEGLHVDCGDVFSAAKKTTTGFFIFSWSYGS
jgi:hypothetical protein